MNYNIYTEKEIKIMGKLKGKITQMASNMYSEEKIVDKSFNGTHNGEDMRQIFNRIMTNPNIKHERAEGSSVTQMILDGKNIGWYDTERMMGDIDQKYYDKLKEMEANAEISGQEIVSEESFNQMKNAYNENKADVIRAMKENPDNKFGAAAGVIAPPENREIPFDGDYDGDFDDEYDGSDGFSE